MALLALYDALTSYRAYACSVLDITAQLTVGNILPVGAMPEGSVICNVEGRPGDRGSFARCVYHYASLF